MNNRAIAIDPAWSKDKDDAIDVEFLGKDGWLVKVYVPDVAFALLNHPEKAKEACDQGVTLYSSKSIKTPMLGEELTQKLSLSSVHASPMLKIEMSLNHELEVEILGIQPVHERIFADISYETADIAIKDKNHPLHKKISLLWTLGSLLQKKRSQLTDSVFDIEGGVYTNEEGNLVTLGQEMAHRSTIIVMELMIMTNAALAKYAVKNHLPILFRNHMLQGMERGDRKSSAHAIAEQRGISIEAAYTAIKSMGHEIQPAVIEAISKGHHGLDLEAYGWFTSPLRRFCDVINLSSVAYRKTWPDLDAVGERLTIIHNAARSSSSEHHARINRKKLLTIVALGKHAEAMNYDLHTLLIAMMENGVKTNYVFENHIRKRMARDDLSTRDMQDLVERSSDLFTSDFQSEIEFWIESSKARQIILKGMIGEMDLENVNYKGILLERAAKLKANVTFRLQSQSGPVHEPLFTSIATWKLNSQEISAAGVAKTLKEAEKKAAYQVLEQLGPLTEDATLKVAVSQTNPKGALLEYAAKNKDKVDFGEAIKTGPEHKPSFEVEVTYQSTSTRNGAKGHGASKKEAEADACRKILEQMIL